MKTKNTLFAVLLLITVSMFGQKQFDKFHDMDDVQTVIVTQKAFELMAVIKTGDDEADEYLELVKELNSLQVIVSENKDIAEQMKIEANNYIEQENLSELIRVKDDSTKVKIYTKDGTDVSHISELFMFVEGISKHMEGSDRKPEAVIVSITGDIDLNKISELTNQMNIPGGEHLKKAEKK
jgi:hypothetical protein